MDLLDLALGLAKLLVAAGAGAAAGYLLQRPAQRVGFAFNCRSCGATIDGYISGFKADRFDLFQMPIRMGWRIGSDGAWHCGAHDRASEAS